MITTDAPPLITYDKFERQARSIIRSAVRAQHFDTAAEKVAYIEAEGLSLAYLLAEESTRRAREAWDETH